MEPQRPGSGGLFRVFLEDAADNGVTYSSGVGVLDGVWHHLAATRDASGNLVLYVDGVTVATFSNTVTPSPNCTQTLTIGCRIGSNISGQIGPQVPIGFFGGGIDEVAMWSRALTGSEVLDVFQNGVNPGSTGLKGYWDFDESSGQQVLDSSPTGNNGFLGTDSLNADPADPARIEPSECFLVVGNSPSPGTFSGAGHTWSTQLSGISASYAVLLDDIPSLPIPVSAPRKLKQFPVAPVGEFHVQILLWNPIVFPTNPEQWSKALHVTMWSNGTATAQRSGSKNGLIISMETYWSGGQSFVRFPFSIIGF